MIRVIVAFPRIEDAKNIKNVLVRNGFSVAAIGVTGAQAVNYAESLDGGIIVCGYRFTDMLAWRLKELLPPGFDMLMVASPSLVNERRGDVVCISMPLKIHDLVNTLHMMVQAQEQRRRKLHEIAKTRSDQERSLIDEAKRLLIRRNNMTEPEAYRYIQKCSMDSGTNMVETAQMIISMFH